MYLMYTGWLVNQKFSLLHSASGASISAMAEWTVKPQNLFRLFMPEDSETPRLHGYILAEVSIHGSVEDSFQVCVRGEQHVKINFPASRVTAIPTLQQYNFTLDTRPEEIFFNENQTVSPWVDIGDLVRRRSLLVTDNGQEANEDFSRKIEVNSQQPSKNRHAILE